MRYNFGQALAQAYRFDEALPQLQEAVRLQPRYPRAHSQLATVLRQLGLAAPAEQHYRIALEQEPGQPEATWNLADLLAAAGRLDEARPLYARFLEIAPPERYAAQRRHAAMVLGR